VKGGPHPRVATCNRCHGTGIDNHASAKFRKGGTPQPCPKCAGVGTLTAPDCGCGCGAPVAFRGSRRDGSHWTPYASPKCSARATKDARARSVRLNSAKRRLEDTAGDVWRRWRRRPATLRTFDEGQLAQIDALVQLVAKASFVAGKKVGYNVGYGALPREERLRIWREARLKTPAA
jgi:hypothetical protein